MFRDLTFIGARSHDIRNELFFKCRMCNYESSVWSKLPPQERLDANAGIVEGAILTGIGYTQIQQNLVALDIKCIAPKIYQNFHDIIAEGFAKAAEESMNTATEEERSLAIQCNDVINGLYRI